MKRIYEWLFGLSFAAFYGFAGAAESIEGASVPLCFTLSVASFAAAVYSAYKAGFMYQSTEKENTRK